MTDEIKTEEVITKTERDQNISDIFNTMYDMLRRFAATTPNDIENLRRLSKTFYLTIEKIAEHRAKVICGEYIKLIKDDIGAVLADIKPKKGKVVPHSGDPLDALPSPKLPIENVRPFDRGFGAMFPHDNVAAAETVPDHLKKDE